MLVSKKLPGICLVPIELEVDGKAPAEGAQAPKQLLATGLACYREVARIDDMDLNVVAFLQLERFDNGRGKADGEAIAPFGDLHRTLRGYTQDTLYILLSESSSLRREDDALGERQGVR